MPERTPPPLPTGVGRMDLHERVSRSEWRHDQTEDRLRAGAETMAEMKAAISAISEQLRPKPINWWKVVAAALPIAILAGGYVWALARYPDREEFTKAQDKAAAAQKALDERVQGLTVEQVRVGGDVQQLKSAVQRTETSLQSIDDKLDRALGGRSRRTP